jgi:hypothetical protein
VATKEAVRVSWWIHSCGFLTLEARKSGESFILLTCGVSRIATRCYADLDTLAPCWSLRFVLCFDPSLRIRQFTCLPTMDDWLIVRHELMFSYLMNVGRQRPRSKGFLLKVTNQNSMPSVAFKKKVASLFQSSKKLFIVRKWPRTSGLSSTELFILT